MRYFPHWLAMEATAMRSNYAEVDEDGIPALLGETVVATLKMGKKFTESGATEASAGAMIDSWEANFSEFMPSNERVAQVMDLEGVPTLDDFLRIYESPVEIEMESDFIWPPERAAVY